MSKLGPRVYRFRRRDTRSGKRHRLYSFPHSPGVVGSSTEDSESPSLWSTVGAEIEAGIASSTASIDRTDLKACLLVDSSRFLVGFGDYSCHPSADSDSDADLHHEVGLRVRRDVFQDPCRVFLGKLLPSRPSSDCRGSFETRSASVERRSNMGKCTSCVPLSDRTSSATWDRPAARSKVPVQAAWR